MYESMVIYRSFYEAIKDLDPAIAGQTYNAILGYGLNGEEPDLEGVAKAIFTLVKPQIDANNRRKENGAKGGRDKTKEEPNSNLNLTKTEPKPNQTETKVEPNVNVNVNANVNANVVKNNKGAQVRYADDDTLDSCIRDFIDHRKKLRKPMTDRAIELFIKRLESLCPNNTAGQINLIQTAIERGWQTVYPSKETHAEPKKTNSKLQELEALYLEE